MPNVHERQAENAPIGHFVWFGLDGLQAGWHDPGIVARVRSSGGFDSEGDAMEADSSQPKFTAPTRSRGTVLCRQTFSLPDGSEQVHEWHETVETDLKLARSVGIIAASRPVDD